ncbi:D-aminoacyl-tRNA deacylase [Candidatus Margulisiibacteriota bacterium]
MRAVIQRVNSASVEVEGKEISRIGNGLLVFLGVKEGDGDSDLDYMAEKTVNLRIFEDQQGKMNLSPLDQKSEVLVVSQFTLYGDVRRGRRPDFTHAAKPEKANALYEKFVQKLKGCGLKVEAGQFQAMMNVKLENDGPVTVMLDSEKVF